MIGILYESREWSSYKLRDEVCAQGIECTLIDLEEEQSEKMAQKCSFLVNRVFASSVFRGHEASLKRVSKILDHAQEHHIPVLNPPESHWNEISKRHSMKVLENHGILVPKVYGTFQVSKGPEGFADDKSGKSGNISKELDLDQVSYPCIIKPDCGGRTTLTYLVNDEKELQDAIRDAQANGPEGICMLVCEYIFPEKNYITRVEVIGGVCRLIVKRSIAENGLSAYHLGSKYAIYDDCPDAVKELAESACAATSILMGSLDIIETGKGAYVIDVNAVSNVSEDNTEMFQFDLMKEYAEYIAQEYKKKQ
jgi:ribosomal protein S6--L-glutamate ligase